MKIFLVVAVGILLSVVVSAQDTSLTRLGNQPYNGDPAKMDSSPVQRALMFVEDMPEFPGGEQAMQSFIIRHLRYPHEARENGFEGVVVIQFTVTETGSLTDVKVLRSPHESLSAEATRIVMMMPTWNPGRSNGNLVQVYYNLPITFELSQDSRPPSTQRTNTDSRQEENGAAAIKYFDRANDAKAKGQFHQADSLYTVSLSWARFAATFFNRALVRQALNNKEGYCEDMAYAASLGDVEAWQLHCKNCGTLTTLYKSADGLPLLDSMGYSVRTHIQGSPYFEQYYFITVSSAGDTLEDFVVYRNGDTVRFKSVGYTPAEFPGGDEAFDKYIDANLFYPKKAKMDGVQGTVIVAFNVSDDGRIYNIRSVRGVEGLTEEAMRFTRVLPRFIPAKRNGIPVSSSVRMPLRFGLFETTGIYNQRYVR